MPKIFGVRSMEVRMNPDEAMSINLDLVAEPGYDARVLYGYGEWNELFPDKVVVKCQFCGQWGARKTSCRHCGGSIE